MLLRFLIFITILTSNLTIAQWIKTNNYGLEGGYARTIEKTPNGLIFVGTNQSDGTCRSTNEGVSWEVANNGLNNSEINSIISDSQGVLYAGCLGNIYKSTDNGNSWIELITGYWINDLAIDSNGVIYAGGIGILKSTDNGNTWNDCSPSFSFTIQSLEINSNNHIFCSTLTHGVLVSTDGGEDWELKNAGITTTGLLSITILSDNTILVGAIGGKIFRSTNNGDIWFEVRNAVGEHIQTLAKDENEYIYAGSVDYAGGGNGGLARSTDYGQSWQYINQGIDEKNIWSIEPLGNNLILAGAENSGVYRSTNSGLNWTKSNNGLVATEIRGLVSGQNGNLFASGLGSIFMSTDEGNAWEIRNGGWNAFNCTKLFYHPPNYIYLGEAGNGIFRTSDYGLSWFHLLNSGNVFDFGFNSLDHIFSIVDNKVYRSTNDGQDWTIMNNGITNANIYCIDVDSSDILMIGSDLGVYISTDNGISWNNSSSGLNDIFIVDIKFINSQLIFVGTYYDGVYRSTDNGMTWIRKSNGIQPSPLGSIIWTDNITLINNSLLITVTGNVYKSYNWGENWLICNDGLQPAYIRAFATKTSNLYASSTAGVWKRPIVELTNNAPYFLPSEIDTIAWVDSLYEEIISAEDLDDDSLIFTVLQKPNFLELIQTNNIPYSAILSGTPELADTGLQSISIQVADIYGSSDTLNWILYVYDNVTNGDLVHDIPKEFVIYQNHPNPFNPNTKIKYSIPQSSKVIIKVLGILGNEIETLVNEEKPAGTYEITWYAENLPSGVYFYRFQAGEFISTKKMILLK